MKKLGYIVTLLVVMSAFSFSSQAGQAKKKPPMIEKTGQGGVKKPPVIGIGKTAQGGVKKPPMKKDASVKWNSSL